MGLATVNAKKVYVTNGATTEFSFPNKFYAETDIVVTLYTIATGATSVLALTTDYTIKGAADGLGGFTDYTAGATITTVATHATGFKIVIQRLLPLTQTFDFVPGGDFDEDSFEEELDRVKAVLQQHQEQIDRSIKLDIAQTSPSSVFDVSDLTVTLDDFVVDELGLKTTPVNTDHVPIADSAASNVNKKVLISSLIQINLETEKTGLHIDDLIYIEDSQASNAKKKVKAKNIQPINGLTEKTALANADLIVIEDSAASNAKKKVQAKNVLPINTQTEKTTLVDDDLFIIEDSADSNAKKKVKKSNITQTQVEVFTTGGTWTCPAGVNVVLVSLVGGGGGGGNDTAGGSQTGAGGGSAAESIINHPLVVTPTSTYAITIGAGGAGGEDGNDSSMVGDDYTITATKGLQGADQGGTPSAGGVGATGNTNVDGADGAGGVGGLGGTLYSYPGGAGGDGQNAVPGAGGGGGSSMFGVGGAGSQTGTPVQPGAGQGYGSGGGGCAGNGSGTGFGTGGAGAPGICILIYNKNGTPS